MLQDDPLGLAFGVAIRRAEHLKVPGSRLISGLVGGPGRGRPERGGVNEPLDGPRRPLFEQGPRGVDVDPAALTRGVGRQTDPTGHMDDPADAAQRFGPVAVVPEVSLQPFQRRIIRRNELAAAPTARELDSRPHRSRAIYRPRIPPAPVTSTGQPGGKAPSRSARTLGTPPLCCSSLFAPRFRLEA